MDALTIAILVVVALALAAGLAFYFYSRRRQSEHLQERFGREYDQALDEHGDRRKAESELKERVERVEKLSIGPLPEERRKGFSQQWDRVQARFVDDPPGAVEEADQLVQEVMVARGYPVGNFEQRAADISVDHPNVVANYRNAHAMSIASRDGRATTDDLREGFVSYRELFRELLEPEAASESERPAPGRRRTA